MTGAPPTSVEETRARIESAALASSARARALLAAAPDVEPTTVFVRASAQGRVTGWDVECPEHGSLPQLAPTRDAAVIAAGDHLDADHHGRGHVKVIRAKTRGRSRVRGRG